jgi:hypothetical protein
MTNRGDRIISLVQGIMTEFADSTGLSPTAKAHRRYLWTDAFAVCNFIELYHQTNNPEYKRLALSLVDQVHTVLGRHRDDDSRTGRTGWISGLDEQEGRRHPTIGGLRIGKKMNERKPGEPYNEDLEWDRDGQYYHYLTKWMHALDRVSRVFGDAKYNTWAIELAKTAHSSFTYLPPGSGRKRMYWKMSIDLSYPLVASMGHLDPLDGFVIYNRLQMTSSRNLKKSEQMDLSTEIADMEDICEEKTWVTDDPLGIGDLLVDSFKLAQLINNGYIERSDLLENLLDSALFGIENFVRGSALKLNAGYRLAFREFGLSIGLKALQRMQKMIQHNPLPFGGKHRITSRVEALLRFAPYGEMIEQFWLEPENRKAITRSEHQDINMVMLATSLAPDGYLS